MGVKLSDGRTFHVISPWSMSLPFSSVTLAIAGQRSSFKWVADLTVDETRAIIRELQEAIGDTGSSDAERAIAALPDAVAAAVMNHEEG
jgi:hypothetical protein